MGSLLPAITALVVGGYTAEAQGEAPGLRVLAPNQSADALHEVHSVEVSSPSYLVHHPRLPLLVAATETDPARLLSFAVASDGRLTPISEVAVPGEFACHLALSPSGDLVVVACYGSGSVASFHLDETGRLSPYLDQVRFSGTGPDSDRQDAPHAHQVLFDADEVLICDLGTDRVHRLGLDARGRFRAAEPVRLPSGFGPRHGVLSEDHLVVVGELSGELWVGRRSAGGWTATQQVAASATSGSGLQPSGIVTDGHRLFVANRGPDTIAVFEWQGGQLTRTGEFACGGSWPRDLTVAAGMLWVANERSATVTAFALSDLPAAGPALTVPSPSPTRVVVLPLGGPVP